ncbi:hypothetical protein JCM8208_000300 [Rhodotorula glutinis]
MDHLCQRARKLDRQVKAVTTKGKLSSSLLQGVVDAAIHNIQSDSRIVSILYRHHKKAAAANKLTSLYLVDGIAREARSRQKKLDREAKGKAREGAAQSPTAPAVGSTTPTLSPPPAASPAPAAASAGSGTFASFLKILEAGMLAKFVLDNWENGLTEHREKVRKVLDIWTKAATFSPSAMARVSQKLLAAGSSSSSTKTARVASPARPSLSPDLSPPPEAKPVASATSGGASSTIPADVLALLQASTEAPPSEAAIEQKRQEEMQAEVERVLREAQMGGKGVSSTAYGSAPPPRSAFTPSASYSASAYPRPTPPYSTAPPAPNPSSSTVPHLALDASQLAALQQIAGGLNGHGAQPQPAPQQQPAAPSNGAAYSQRPGHAPPPPPQQQYQHHQQASYDGPRGYTRSYDEAQHGYGSQHEGPPAKRPFQPAPPQQQPHQQQQHSRPPPPPPQYSPPHQSTSSYASPAPPVTAAAPSPAAPTPSPAPTSSAPPSSSFDSTAFDATSVHSWSTFVFALRSAHPFFAGRPTPPTMEEIMSLCAPSAMMAFGAGGGAATGQQEGMGIGGMGGHEEGGMGEAGQGEGPSGFAGGDGGFAGAEGGY